MSISQEWTTAKTDAERVSRALDESAAALETAIRALEDIVATDLERARQRMGIIAILLLSGMLWAGIFALIRWAS